MNLFCASFVSFPTQQKEQVGDCKTNAREYNWGAKLSVLPEKVDRSIKLPAKAWQNAVKGNSLAEYRKKTGKIPAKYRQITGNYNKAIKQAKENLHFSAIIVNPEFPGPASTMRGEKRTEKEKKQRRRDKDRDGG